VPTFANAMPFIAWLEKICMALKTNPSRPNFQMEMLSPTDARGAGVWNTELHDGEPIDGSHASATTRTLRKTADGWPHRRLGTKPLPPADRLPIAAKVP